MKLVPSPTSTVTHARSLTVVDACQSFLKAPCVPSRCTRQLFKAMGHPKRTKDRLSEMVQTSTKQSRKDQSRRKEWTVASEDDVDNVFDAFDRHRNDRISRENIRSVATEHGIDMTNAELNDMILFFDSSGTATLSRADFKKLWRETSS